MRIVMLLICATCFTRVATGQGFGPPKNSSHTGTRFGLLGFGVRGGLDLAGDGQFLLGTTLDMGNLFTNRVRMRPSFDLGVFNGPNTYAGSFDLLWRFTEDEEVTTPYIGAGLSLAGHDGCGNDSQCPDVWLNLTFGFELHYRSTFNWLLEYRAVDAFDKHRLYVGLTTRRGN